MDIGNYYERSVDQAIEKMKYSKSGDHITLLFHIDDILRIITDQLENRVPKNLSPFTFTRTGEGILEFRIRNMT